MFNLGLRSYRGRGRERLVEVFVVGYDKENSGLEGRENSFAGGSENLSSSTIANKTGSLILK